MRCFMFFSLFFFFSFSDIYHELMSLITFLDTFPQPKVSSTRPISGYARENNLCSDDASLRIHVLCCSIDLQSKLI